MIKYEDFHDTRYVACGNDLEEIPRLTESNFMQLIDAHNTLIDEVNKIIKNTNKNGE